MKSLRAVVLMLALALSAGAQTIGDSVRLDSPSAQGVPVHPAAGDPSFVRWANGTVGRVTAIDQPSGWFRIESSGSIGWVVKRYLTVIADDPDPDELGTEILAYVVGTWNLEHFKDGATRGFPENTNGGPSYPSRIDADFARIAEIIRNQLFAKVLVLNEINGRSGTKQSDELDRPLTHLGMGWAYELTSAGHSQRIAILYDSRFARKESCTEITVAEQDIEGKDVFERDPIACLFTFLDATGQARNDLIVVGVHLASGQHLVQNHNTAMGILRDRVNQAIANGTFPSGERDVLIGGDLNASRYDTKLENFWVNFDSARLDLATLAPVDGTEYPPTRLAGVPLHPKSQIDYLIASKRTGGLFEEIVQVVAHVHYELLLGGFDDFRQHVSDHIPVTVRIKVVPDVD